MKRILLCCVFTFVFFGATLAQVPNDPVGLTATGQSPSSIGLTWTQVTGSPSADGYILYAATSTGTFPSASATPTNDTDLSDGNGVIKIVGNATTSYGGFTGFAAGTAYTFRIYAYRNSNLSNNFDEDAAYTFATAPGAYPGTFSFAATASASGITLNFTKASKGSLDAHGYLVLRNSSANPSNTGIHDGTAPTGTYLIGMVTDSTASQFTDTDATLSPGMTYHYALVPYRTQYIGTTPIDDAYNYGAISTFATATMPVTITLVQLTGGIAASPLGAGATNQAVLGFSITVDGPTTLTSVNIPLSSNPNLKFSNPRLFESADATFGGDASIQTGTATTTQFEFNAIGKTLAAGTTNFFIVVDVDNGVTPSTPPIRPTLSPADLAFTPGTVQNFTTFQGHNYSFWESPSSDIILNGGTTPSVAYQNFQSATGLTSANSVSLATFSIRDGGASGDGDSQSTVLTNLTLQLNNFGNVRRIALFDGTTNLIEQDVTSNTVTFSGLAISAADDDLKNITVRATFQATVTDNVYIPLTITAAIGTGSGFASTNAGGATTGATANQIEVTATKVIVSPDPQNGQANTDFTLTVGAVDDLGNRDLDETGNVTLTHTSGGGTLSASEGITRPLSAGQYTWTTVQLTLAGAHVITANHAVFSGANDGTATVNISSLGVNIAGGTTSVTLCYNGNYQPLSNITITESDPADFGAGTARTFALILPDGFIFRQNTSIKPAVSGNEITNPSFYNYPSNNIVRFSYTVNGTTNATLDQIIVSGLEVKYTGNAPTATGTIYRFGGSAIQSGNADTDGKSHGTLNANAQTFTVDFTVDELPGEPEVAPDETRFPVTSKAVKLIGAPAGGTFSGSGTINSSTHGPIFDIPTVGVGASYPIVYTYKATPGENPQECIFTKQKSFEVFASIIQNLNLQYCLNSSSATGLNVPQAQINARYGAGYTLVDFVFYDPGAGGWVPISAPNNTTFDPDNAIYNAAYSTWNYSDHSEVPIGYRITNGSVTYVPEYSWIVVKHLPVVSFSIPKLSFCSDEAAVSLVGTPAQTSTDEFNGTGVSNPSGTQWLFSPSAVPGATSSPQTVPITYQYTDPSSGCSNTAVQTVSVNPRPGAVTAANLNPGTSISVCQNGTPGSFNATPEASTTYTWYNNTFTNISSGNTFSPTAPHVNTATPGTTNFYVTQTRNGCESTTLTLTVTVNATPATPGASFAKQYCIGETIPNSDFSISGSNLKWFDAATSQPIAIGNPNQPTTAELGISNASANKYGYIVTQTVSGCESQPISVTATVYERPKISISSTSNLSTICKTGSIINLAASPGDGLWNGTASAALINTDKPAGTTQLNPSSLSPGAYTLRYDYTDPSTTCSNSETANLTVLPTINPSVTFGNTCNGLPVEFTNTSEIVPSSSGATITGTSWSFVGDGSGLETGNGPVPANTNGGRTGGTYFSPTHIFSGTGTFQYSLTMYTSDGCAIAVAPQPITIHPIPEINFTWSNVCSDAINGSTTQFNASTTNGVAIETYDWNFNSNQVLGVNTFTPGQNPVVNYKGSGTLQSYGRDTVKLVVSSFAHCIDSVKKPVFIVPSYPAISENNAYVQAFDATSDGWIAGGVNSSWQMGAPAGTVITDDANGGGQAWVTNLYGNNNPNEQSWVLSPCFDFTDAHKPVISLDIYSDTPRGLDGAVLQYNESGNIADDSQWFVVGNLTAGVNWYDQQGIDSKPGNQASGDLGWTGDASGGKYTGWKHAVFKLDELINKSGVVFRIAFASKVGSQEGFAFDNVFIGERSRNVLIESFTNSSAPGAGAHNTFFNDFASASTEVVKIQYHTSFPGDDPLNQANRPLNDARTAFYGISTSPTLRIDGQYSDGAVAGWANTIYDNRVLDPSHIKINFNSVTKDDGVVKINTSIQNTTAAPVSLEDAHVFTVVLEKSITDAAWLGQSGSAELIYVAKEILPNAAGIVLSHTLAPGETLQLPEIIWKDASLIDMQQGAIAVFVQSGNGTREVYQAQLYDHPVIPDVVTEAESGLAGNINIFPNPSDQEFSVVLSEKAQHAIAVKLIDSYGRVVYTSSLARGNSGTSVLTKDLASGVYILQLETPKGIIRRKIITSH